MFATVAETLAQGDSRTGITAVCLAARLTKYVYRKSFAEGQAKGLLGVLAFEKTFPEKIVAV